MLTRRQLMKRGAVGGAALMVPTRAVESALAAATPLKSFVTDLAKYIPPIVPVANGETVALAVRPVQRIVHRDAAATPTPVWAYELATGDPRGSPSPSSWIGPILALDAGSAVNVSYTVSAQITSHMFATSIDTAVLDPWVVEPGASTTRFMTHLHGSHVSGANDGNPFATPHTAEATPGQPEVPTPRAYPAQNQLYAGQQRAALIWYHQHAHGLTHLNVYAGLAGGYLLRDGLDTGRNDNQLGLPANVVDANGNVGLYEVPLVIQDRIFQAGGGKLNLFYPPKPWIPEFFGDEMCVNGAVEPFLDVEPRLYRFRIINGCNARFLNLDWKLSNLTLAPTTMHVIGSDGGLLATPSTQATLVVSPGERYDLVVDFSQVPVGETVDLVNKSPLPKAVVNPAGPLPRIMRFRVSRQVNTANLPAATFSPAGALTSDTPATLPTPGSAGHAGTRYHTFEEVIGARGPLGAVINGKSFEGRKINPAITAGYPFYRPNDPNNPPDAIVGVQETPANGTTEDWLFANTTADSHPLHMHLTQFGVIERLPFNVAAYVSDLANARAVKAGQPPPNPWVQNPPPTLEPNDTINPLPYVPAGAVGTPVSAAEKGWKDTVQMHPGEVTRIRQRFDLTGFSGDQDYVFHCHILEHETNSMMRPYRVTA